MSALCGYHSNQKGNRTLGVSGVSLHYKTIITLFINRLVSIVFAEPVTEPVKESIAIKICENHYWREILRLSQINSHQLSEGLRFMTGPNAHAHHEHGPSAG